MLPIDLNFQKADKTKWHTLGWLLLIVGIGVNLSLFFYHQATLNLIKEDLVKLEKIYYPAKQKLPAKNTEQEVVLTKQLKQAEMVIHQLNTPWADLFNQLEAVRMDNVSLMAFVPDSESGQVQLEGQADSLQAIFDYMTQIQSKPLFTKVELSSQEKDKAGGINKIKFSILAKWRAEYE